MSSVMNKKLGIVWAAGLPLVLGLAGCAPHLSHP